MMSPKQERRTTARLIVANVQAADAPQSRSNVNALLHAKPTISEPTS
jgi:type IV secretory pathway VirD2 relaxase